MREEEGGREEGIECLSSENVFFNEHYIHNLYGDSYNMSSYS